MYVKTQSSKEVLGFLKKYMHFDLTKMPLYRHKCRLTFQLARASEVFQRLGNQW